MIVKNGEIADRGHMDNKTFSKWFCLVGSSIKMEELERVLRDRRDTLQDIGRSLRFDELL